jgi:Universal stress protein family
MTPQVVDNAGGQQPADGKGCERDPDGQPVAAGVDGSPPSKVAVDWAARDAQLRNLPLTLVHAAPNAANHDPVPAPRRVAVRPGAPDHR